MMRNLYVALSVPMVLVLAPAWGQQPSAVETTYVYKPDGTQHCDTAPGISLDSMAKELVRIGIPVYARRKSHDGREGVAVCGNPTGSINVYEIAESDLPKAFQLGFQRLGPSWFEAR